MTRRLLISLGICFLYCTINAGNVSGQPAPDLRAAFKRCSQIVSENGSSRILASDNEQNIYYTDDGYSIISIDAGSGVQNWRTQTGGKIFSTPSVNADDLFFLSYFEDGTNGRITSVNSVSLRTGLINWKKTLSGIDRTGTENLRLHAQAPGGEFLYIAAGNSLLALEKTNGSILWSKSFPEPIEFVENADRADLSVLTESAIYRLSGKTGENTQYGLSPKSAVKLLNSGGSDSILGYRTGEIIKIRTADKQNERIWKLKTGGSVSGLYEYENNLIATSLDNFIYMISKENGNLKWKKRVSGRILIRPLISKNHALILTSGDNLATVVDLADGKAVNQIRIEEDNYFSGESYISGELLVLQTFRGIYYFTNTNKNCR